MSEQVAPPAAYQAAIKRLEAWLKRRYFIDRKQVAKSTGALKKELRAIEAALVKLADRIEFGSAAFELDDAADLDSAGAGTRPALQAMRDLAQSAKSAREGLLDPRALPAVELAALLFLHLRYRHRQTMPSSYVGHAAVQAFADLLATASGNERGPDRALTLLKAAMKQFDPFMPPNELSEID